MKINAIIAEYNPLHKGHIYQMEDAKTNTGADYTIVLMSGNYVQRGAPAIMDKHTRAEMALQAGADMVLELPPHFSCSSAEYFANGSVAILKRIGVIDYLCFGSECGDLDTLHLIATILADESKEYQTILQQGLANGKSFPQARNDALFQVEPSLLTMPDYLTSPNNILAIEYLKAMRKHGAAYKPYTTLRTGSNYHSSQFDASLASAKAIREAIYSDTDKTLLADKIPSETQELFKHYFNTYRHITNNDFSDILYYTLLSHSENGFSQFADVSSDLSNRIQNTLSMYKDFDSYCNLLKSKELTYTRISRCLMHIMLGIRKTDFANPYSDLSYVRVLGFRKSALPLLKEIDQKTSLKLITKVADAKNLLSPKALTSFEHHLRMDTLYYYIQGKKANRTPQNEYTIPICIQ